LSQVSFAGVRQVVKDRRGWSSTSMASESRCPAQMAVLKQGCHDCTLAPPQGEQRGVLVPISVAVLATDEGYPYLSPY